MTDRGETTSVPDVEDLYALGGGRVGRGLERLQLARGARLRVGRVAALLAAVTWLPLLVLAAIQGVAWGSTVQVPFLPLVFLVMPAREVLRTLARLLV